MSEIDEAGGEDLLGLGGVSTSQPREEPTRCPGCREIVGTGGGNCPHCGTYVPIAQAAPRHQMPVQFNIPSGHPPPPSRSPWLYVGGAAAALALLGAVAFAVVDSEGDPPATQAEPAARAAAREPKTTEGTSTDEPAEATQWRPDYGSEVDTAWTDANRRAKLWSEKALLFDVEIGPVQKKHVQLGKEGKIQFRFGIPKDRGFADGTALGTRSLVVSTTSQGTTQTEEAAPPGQLAVTDPTCPYSEVVRLIGTWSADEDFVSIRFGYGKRFGKAVWTVQSEADPPLDRVLEGSECKLVVR